MTVEELINELEKLPPDSDIYVEDCEYAYKLEYGCVHWHTTTDGEIYDPYIFIH